MDDQTKTEVIRTIEVVIRDWGYIRLGYFPLFSTHNFEIDEYGNFTLKGKLSLNV